MSHTVVAKLNKAARQHQNANGVTFFVDLGEKNYNFQTKQNEYTNYSAALFAKDGQIDFYTNALIEGAVIEVSGTGIILEMPSDPQYKPKLMIQDAKLGYVNSPMQGAPQQAPAQQSWGNAPQQPPVQQAAPQMAPAYQPQQAPRPTQQAAPQAQPQQAPAPQQRPAAPQAQPQQAPAAFNEPSMDFDDDIPF